jgi:Cu2+-containing amine oxidase
MGKSAATFHPLDPLTATEILAASKCCALYHAATAPTALRFNTITLLEPEKEVLLAYDKIASTSPTLPLRRAFVVLEVIEVPNNQIV